MDSFDVIVIGGGLLGCFAARNLTRYKLKTALFEAREDLCTGISRANTAIVYSGCHTKPGTLKSQMCVSAAKTFANLCAELGVRYVPCGSIMICTGPKGEEKLHEKLSKGIQNGVSGIKLLSREELIALEPNLSPNVRLGLFDPQAGTVMPWELALAAAENAVQNGAEIRLNTKVTDIKKVEGGYQVYSGDTAFFARGIINCAGLFADEILEKVQKPTVRIFPSSGDYFLLDTKAKGFVKHVILYESEEKCRGVTLVPTVDGNILISSSKFPSNEKDGFKTTSKGQNALKEYITEAIPNLPMEHVIRSFGVIRPNPFYVHYDSESNSYLPEDTRIHEFTIDESQQNPAFLSFIGIKTPGLTCSNELGRHAAERMASLFEAEMNPEFDPKRPAPIRLNDLPYEERASLVENNPAYGAIVCRCRKISEGEIIDSIRRTPGAVTVDGVKRRTGACLGRCQGSFCTQRIMEILARELHVTPDRINKDVPGSYLVEGKNNDIL
jgi:glycerol-3-phosphate dehydrogenase